MTSLLGAPVVRRQRAKEVRGNRTGMQRSRWTRSFPRTGGVLNAVLTPYCAGARASSDRVRVKPCFLEPSPFDADPSLSEVNADMAGRGRTRACALAPLSSR